MTDNGDGSYSYSFKVLKQGIISILVGSRQNEYVEATLYYDNFQFTGTPTLEIWPSINRPDMTPIKSSTFKSFLKGPT